MNNEVIKVIGKYALLLSVFYIIDIALGHYIAYLTKDMDNYELKSMWLGIPAVTRYVLNIITAVVIASDKKKLNIKEKYSVLLTIFYRPIGVVLFLIYLINKGLERSSTHNIGS